MFHWIELQAMRKLFKRW